MRTWRVGTFSMGVSLVALGLFLGISQFKGWEALQPFLLWWPFILIVLGAEVLVYLFVSKQEHPRIKYDVLSIFFVGVLGTVGIALTVLVSTGVLQEVRTVVSATEKSFALPEVSENLASEIERVVVETGNQYVQVETTTGEQLHIFGAYRTTIEAGKVPPIVKKEDYVVRNVVGDTMYIQFKVPEQKTGPFSIHTVMTPTIAIPDSVTLEVRGRHNLVKLNVQTLKNNWTVKGAEYVELYVNEKNDLELITHSHYEQDSAYFEWEKVSNENDDAFKGVYKLGEGTYQLSILESSSVALNIGEG